MFDEKQMLLIGTACLSRMVALRGHDAMRDPNSTEHKLYESYSEIVQLCDSVIGDDDNPYWTKGD